jgi:hypothetical protein
LTPVIYLQTGDLEPGDCLAQDIFVGTQVLLRNGTVLAQAQIERLRKLPLSSVAVQREEGLPPAAAAEAYTPDSAMFELPAVGMPAVRQAVPENAQNWLSNEYFSQPVPVPADIPDSEKYFAQIKDALRVEAGLAPAMSQEQQDQLTRDLHASLISAAIRKGPDLDQLGGIADEVSQAAADKPEGYLRFSDIQQYGQYLSGKAVNASLVLSRILPEDSREALGELTRVLFAISALFALAPGYNEEGLAAPRPEDRETLSQGLLNYFGWLGSRSFASEETLQTAMLQFERSDGSGLPYGLSGDMIPKLSESIALANAYTARVLSQPKRPRQTPRQAADQLIAQSGKAFSGPGVNRFLRSMGYYPLGSMVELNTGATALVVAQSERAMLKPTVRMVQEGGSLGPEVKLVEQPQLFIRRQVLEY